MTMKSGKSAPLTSERRAPLEKASHEACCVDDGAPPQASGTAIKMTRDELFALQHSPHVDIVFYLHLRAKMDFGTGKVGVGKYGVSWGRMAALTRVQPHPGRRQLNMTIDAMRGCGERLKQCGLVSDATQGWRLGFTLPLALTDDDTLKGDSRECVRISSIDLDRLTGAPHGVIVLYLQLRALMNLRDGMVGIAERVSWDYLRDLLRVDGKQGRRAGVFSIDQIRRMAAWLRKLGLIESRSEDRQLIFMLPVAYADFHASKKAASTTPDDADSSARAKKPRAASATDRYIDEEREAELRMRASFPKAGSFSNTSLSSSTTFVNAAPAARAAEQSNTLKFADWVNEADRATMNRLMARLSLPQQQQAIDEFQRGMGTNIKSGIAFFKSIVKNVRQGLLGTLSSKPPAPEADRQPETGLGTESAAERARQTALQVNQLHQCADNRLRTEIARMDGRITMQQALRLRWSDTDPEFRQRRDTARALYLSRVGPKR